MEIPIEKEEEKGSARRSKRGAESVQGEHRESEEDCPRRVRCLQEGVPDRQRRRGLLGPLIREPPRRERQWAGGVVLFMCRVIK